MAFDSAKENMEERNELKLAPRKKRKRGARIRYTEDQLELLSAVFTETSYPTKAQVQQLTKQTRLPAVVVRRWFTQKRFKSSVFGSSERIHLIPRTVETSNTSSPRRKKYKTVLVRIDSPSRTSHSPRSTASFQDGNGKFYHQKSPSGLRFQSICKKNYSEDLMEYICSENQEVCSPYKYGDLESSISTANSLSPDAEYLSKNTSSELSIIQETPTSDMPASISSCDQTDFQMQTDGHHSQDERSLNPDEYSDVFEKTQNGQNDIQQTIGTMPVTHYQYISMNDLSKLGVSVDNFDNIPVLHTGQERSGEISQPPEHRQQVSQENTFVTSQKSLSNNNCQPHNLNRYSKMSNSNSTETDAKSPMVVDRSSSGLNQYTARNGNPQSHVVQVRVVPKATTLTNNLYILSKDEVVSSSSSTAAAEAAAATSTIKTGPDHKKVIVLKRPSNTQNKYVGSSILNSGWQKKESGTWTHTASGVKVVLRSPKTLKKRAQEITPSEDCKIKVNTNVEKGRQQQSANPDEVIILEKAQPLTKDVISNHGIIENGHEIPASSDNLSQDKNDFNVPNEPRKTPECFPASFDQPQKDQDNHCRCCCCYRTNRCQSAEMEQSEQSDISAMPLICFLPLQIPTATLTSLLQQQGSKHS